MLTAQHIMKIKLDGRRLAAHREMDPPGYVTKELTKQIVAIGEATISDLLQVDPEIFKMQLEAARTFGVSYLVEDQQRNLLGVSAATSLIKDTDIMRKNLILPRDYTWKNPQLRAHYVIGLFLKGNVVDGQIPDVEEINVAGWTDTYGLNRHKSKRLPPTFHSKLPVVMMPCSKLEPIETLLPRLIANTIVG